MVQQMSEDIIIITAARPGVWLKERLNFFNWFKDKDALREMQRIDDSLYQWSQDLKPVLRSLEGLKNSKDLDLGKVQEALTQLVSVYSKLTQFDEYSTDVYNTYQEALERYKPQDIKLKSSEEIGQIIKEANFIGDWWRRVKDNWQAQSLMTREQRQKNRENKDKIIKMINYTDRLVSLIERRMDDLENARWRGNLGEYYSIIQEIGRAQDKYRENFKPMFDSIFGPGLLDQAEAAVAEQAQEDKQDNKYTPTKSIDFDQAEAAPPGTDPSDAFIAKDESQPTGQAAEEEEDALTPGFTPGDEIPQTQDNPQFPEDVVPFERPVPEDIVPSQRPSSVKEIVDKVKRDQEKQKEEVSQEEKGLEDVIDTIEKNVKQDDKREEPVNYNLFFTDKLYENIKKKYLGEGESELSLLNRTEDALRMYTDIMNGDSAAIDAYQKLPTEGKEFVKAVILGKSHRDTGGSQKSVIEVGDNFNKALRGEVVSKPETSNKPTPRPLNVPPPAPNVNIQRPEVSEVDPDLFDEELYNKFNVKPGQNKDFYNRAAGVIDVFKEYLRGDPDAVAKFKGSPSNNRSFIYQAIRSYLRKHRLSFDNLKRLRKAMAEFDGEVISSPKLSDPGIPAPLSVEEPEATVDPKKPSLPEGVDVMFDQASFKNLLDNYKRQNETPEKFLIRAREIASLYINYKDNNDQDALRQLMNYPTEERSFVYKVVNSYLKGSGQDPKGAKTELKEAFKNLRTKDKKEGVTSASVKTPNAPVVTAPEAPEAPEEVPLKLRIDPPGDLFDRVIYDKLRARYKKDVGPEDDEEAEESVFYNKAKDAANLYEDAMVDEPVAIASFNQRDKSGKHFIYMAIEAYVAKKGGDPKQAVTEFKAKINSKGGEAPEASKSESVESLTEEKAVAPERYQELYDKYKLKKEKDEDFRRRVEYAIGLYEKATEGDEAAINEIRSLSGRKKGFFYLALQGHAEELGEDADEFLKKFQRQIGPGKSKTKTKLKSKQEAPPQPIAQNTIQHTVDKVSDHFILLRESKEGEMPSEQKETIKNLVNSYLGNHLRSKMGDQESAEFIKGLTDAQKKYLDRILGVYNDLQKSQAVLQPEPTSESELEVPNEEVSSELEQQVNASPEQALLRYKHSKFIEELQKAAATYRNPKILAAMMAKYSEEIDDSDLDGSLKLIAIVEGILDD